MSSQLGERAYEAYCGPKPHEHFNSLPHEEKQRWACVEQEFANCIPARSVEEILASNEIDS